VKLQWKRARTETLLTGTIRRRWLTGCCNYYVEEQKHAGLPTVYLAVALFGGSAGIILGRHRSRKAAEQTCDRHARKGGAQ
jgi:hypothetical protein